jgi:hypothetical protein
MILKHNIHIYLLCICILCILNMHDDIFVYFTLVFIFIEVGNFKTYIGKIYGHPNIFQIAYICKLDVDLS